MLTGPSTPAERLASKRLDAARSWAAGVLGLPSVALNPVSGDASFRRYFRLLTQNGSLILMDAPPQQENMASFVDIDARLLQSGLRAPRILHCDLQQGFGLLEDFGDRLYREVLNTDTAGAFFPGLLELLARMASNTDCSGLPRYDDARLQAELDLFTEWYLARHRQKTLGVPEVACWQSLCHELKRSAAAQPQVFVHRDFHSCNLLYQEGQAAGIIDFQDAVQGPVSYDFVSLLWDRYISWPRSQLEQWMETFRLMLELEMEPAAWVRYCDLMGLQRNLKIVGIFSRLHCRDGKAGYLEMIPRFYRYLLDVLPRYPEFTDCHALLEQPECAP
ncbi:MAG TPA: phosphotransferase [Xanthomonadales bacterium]|nr:phosphotransferase [Xanthomonadales bacterium]